MNSSSDAIRVALDFDPVTAAEDVMGMSYKDDPTGMVSGLGLMAHMAISDTKQKLLFESDDSHFGISIRDFIGLVGRLGFREVFSENIPETEDRLYLYWRDGLLLRFESYWGDSPGIETSVNSASLYFNYAGPYQALHQCSRGMAQGEEDPENCVWVGNRDVREGLRWFLSQAEKHGQFLKKWKEAPFLWLLNYQEPKQEGHDCEAINSRKICSLPRDVQEAMGFL